jgi:hypothetical protein
MAASKSYSASPELEECARRLRERYWLYLGHVDINNIYFAEIEGEKPKKSGVLTLSGVSAPWVKTLLASYGNSRLYCMSVWSDEWKGMATQMREWLIFDALFAIDPVSDGKVRKPDVQEWGVLVEYLGPYWRKRQDLPSLLGGTEPLPIPPPQILEDEGSTLKE